MASTLLGAVLGPALQLQQPSLWTASLYVALVAGGAAAFLFNKWIPRGWPRRIALLLAAACITFATTGWRACAYLEDQLDPALEGRDLVLTGMVAAMPHRSEGGLRLRFEVESARAADQPVTLPPQVLLGWYANDGAQPEDLRPGERWQLAARLKAPHGQVNPHGFDYELWLWEQGLQATGYVRAGPRDPPPKLLSRTWCHPIEQLRHAVRASIYAHVEDPRLAGVLAALVVGDQGAIERADWDVFRATGVAHLMSISGLHVTMFAWAAALAVGLAWRRSATLCLAWPAQHAALVGGVALATAYAVFSGWGVPSQRTIWMLGCVGLLRLGARAWPWPEVWLLACAVVVAIDPWALTQAGFWLSFVAVGVLFATGREPQAKPEGESRWRRLLHSLQGLLHEQWVVTVALTPLSLLLFGQVSVVGLLANLVAIPWVTLVVTPLGLAGVFLPWLWTPAAWAVDLLASGLQWMASLPLATWSAPAPPVWAGAAGVLGGLLLAMPLPWSARLLGAPLLLPVLLWQAPRPPPGEFELLAADVGQGNAVLVRTAHHTLVYDAGPGYSRDADAGQRVLVPLLRAWDERIDMLMLSHRDFDHTGGAAAVLRMQPQAALLSSLEDGHELLALHPGTRCTAGQGWEWDGVRFEVLHPPAEDYEAKAKSNAMSCVLRLANGRATALLAGDLERPQERALLDRQADVRADLLLVPHHGSKTSSSEDFLSAVQPAAALVQAGYRNRFGHPAAEVVARYRSHGIRLVLSAACGAARWRSAAPRQVQCERVLDPRYWRHRLPQAPAGEE
ncbi:DNA internalization-related competence protein ComEC/Rec2 [Ramlibacter sp. G-1-2-2]|uniref:DNA internalization-related competence protein ComEC/Rec2 n=1 Tax=Ramlibacter agri TaxID=2728837 RepID=A0A848H712_9BURK|nr:DNA internalization-related competence protein ComEC/Rec2 [Ramlibacter agri]